MDIEEWRRRIDEIDRQLVKLLNERSRAALAIGRLKRERGMPLYQPEREAEILAAVQRMNGGPLDNEAVRRLFERILDEARSVEHRAYRTPEEPDRPGKKSE